MEKAQTDSPSVATDVPPPPSAEEKSSAVWKIEDQPTVEADPVERSETADGA